MRGYKKRIKKKEKDYIPFRCFVVSSLPLEGGERRRRRRRRELWFFRWVFLPVMFFLVVSLVVSLVVPLVFVLVFVSVLAGFCDRKVKDLPNTQWIVTAIVCKGKQIK